VQNYLLAALLLTLPIVAEPAWASGEDDPSEPQTVANPYYVVPQSPAHPSSPIRPGAWPDAAVPGAVPPGYAPAGLPATGQGPPAGAPGTPSDTQPAYSPSQAPPAYVPNLPPASRSQPLSPGYGPSQPPPVYPPYHAAPARPRTQTSAADPRYPSRMPPAGQMQAVPPYPGAPRAPAPALPYAGPPGAAAPYTYPAQSGPAHPGPAHPGPAQPGPVQPGGPYAAQPGPPPPRVAQQAAPQAPGETGWQENEGARILARVLSEVILASDVMSGVNQLAAANKDRMPADELRKQIDGMVKARLEAAVDTKLLWLDAKRTIPAEAYDELERRIVEHFESKEVPDLIKRAKVSDRRELDEKLREMGTSLEKRKRAFIEMAIAREWLRQKSKAQSEVTLDQVRTYYDSHLAEFEHTARAKWEELAVRFSEHPNKAEAHRKIAWMGNQVFAGQALAEVAKGHSEGSTASQGGQWDWTTQGCLASEVLDRALFALPVGQLSPILESDRGYHIVRVIEREDAHRTPFAEAQAKIREKLEAERQQEQAEEVLAKLKREIPVWTIYDAPESTSPYDAALNPGGSPFTAAGPAGQPSQRQR